MDPTKTTLLVTSQMVTYLLLVSSQQAQPTVRLRRNSRITSFYSPQDSTVYYATSTSTVKTTAIRRRHLMSKRTTRRQLFKQNFRQALNFALDRTSYSAQANGKRRSIKKTLRTPSSSTDICAKQTERLRYAR